MKDLRVLHKTRTHSTCVCVTDCYFIVNVLGTGTVNGELEIAQKAAFEAKGRRYSTGKVIQRLLNIDLYTYLAIYRYR